MTTQNVAWPITIVHSERSTDQNTKNEFSAMPVMIPGRAIGKTNRNETAFCPKKRKRASANAASEPSTSATEVASAPALSESPSAVRTSPSCPAALHHLVVRPGIGQPCTFDELNA